MGACALSELACFSLALMHTYHPERSPDIFLTFPWTSAQSSFGVEGTDFINTRRMPCFRSSLLLAWARDPQPPGS